MSCIFCDSLKHLSEWCDSFETNESRKQILQQKNLCNLCVDKNHCKYNCEIKSKCHICFSFDHHTCFCDDRFKLPLCGVPRIDRILLSRFLNMFEPLEKYAMALISKGMFDITSFKPLKIYPTQRFRGNEQRFNSIIVISKSVLLSESRSEPSEIMQFKIGITSKTIFVNARSLTLRNISLSTTELFQLLSPQIHILEAYNLKFDDCKIVKFSKILKKCQQIKELLLRGENIEIENSWPEELVKFNNKKTVKKLELSLPNYDFNYESLANFMKETEAVKIVIHQPRSKISNPLFFDYFKRWFYNFGNEIPTLSFHILSDGYFGSFLVCPKYVLKNP